MLHDYSTRPVHFRHKLKHGLGFRSVEKPVGGTTLAWQCVGYVQEQVSYYVVCCIQVAAVKLEQHHVMLLLPCCIAMQCQKRYISNFQVSTR